MPVQSSSKDAGAGHEAGEQEGDHGDGGAGAVRREDARAAEANEKRTDEPGDEVQHVVCPAPNPSEGPLGGRVSTENRHTNVTYCGKC